MELNKLKSGIKNGTEVTLKLSSNVVGDSSDESNFSHDLLLTNTHISKLREAFANDSSANIKLSKIQLHQNGQSGRFLGRVWQPLLKTGLTLMKNVLKPLVNSVLIPLGLTLSVSATDGTIQKKTFRSAMKTLTISN